MSPEPRCKDCLKEGTDPKGKRKLARKKDGSLQPGPRCVTHWRAKRKADRARAHERSIAAKYELSPEQYWELYEAQGGRCPICLHARGLSRNLAVDHDHDLCKDHPPDRACPLCIRGLLCSGCNYTLLGRYGMEALLRAVAYLKNPPARKVLQRTGTEDAKELGS